MIRHASVVEPEAAIQLAAEAVLATACIVGYRVEAHRGRLIASAPVKEGSVVVGRVVGDGEWIVLGSSEEESFESLSATPTLTSSGFALDVEGTRIAIGSGSKVEIRAIEGARRAPLDALTTAQGMKTRFTFEVRPGTLLYTDASTPHLQPYRTHEAPKTSIVLAGSKAAAMRRETAFPGCWMMLMVPGVTGALIATLSSAHTVAWVFLGVMALLVVIGITALPSVPKPR